MGVGGSSPLEGTIYQGVLLEEIILIGINVLLEPISSEGTSAGGIVLPNSDSKRIAEGKVVKKGQGFLMPSTEASMDGILEGNSSKLSPKYIQLDVEEGDIVLYEKQKGEEAIIDGKNYIIVSYLDIKLIKRKLV